MCNTLFPFLLHSQCIFSSAHEYCVSQIKLQQLEQLLAVARAKESAEEQEKRRRDESHLALLQTRTEQKDSEARALAEEKLQKQLLAEQKEKKLQELREKWVVSVSEPATGRTKGGKDKDKEAGAGKSGTKKRGRAQKGEGRQVAGEGDNDSDEGGDEEDEALMAMLSGKSGNNSSSLKDIGFGSSDEDEEVAPARTLRTRGAAPAAAPADDIFGDSDEEAPPADTAKVSSAAPARKRLKRSSTAADSSDEDQDGDVDMKGDADNNKGRKQQRIADSDDE